MTGISSAVASELTARGYTESEINRLFDPYGHHGEIRLIYQRGPNSGDRTSPLPSSRHMYYVAKNWTAVEIADPPAKAKEPEISIPFEILDYAGKDRVAIWKRDRDHIESSCRNARSLLAKGWTFAGFADDEQRRAAAEAKPYAATKAASPAATEPKRK